MWIVGVDCATKDTKVGLAFGRYDNGILKIEDATLCSPKAPSTARISDWLHQENRPALLAIDAPLGWPIDLARALTGHRAGKTISTKPDVLFHRETDRFIKQIIGKKPLEVGADRIARTAHAALGMLGELRLRFTAEISLAWSLTDLTGITAIEVYPAATLTAHGFLSSGYKKQAQITERRQILTGLEGKIVIPPWLVSKFESSADTLDAAVCLLAAKDFLDGRAMSPPPSIKSIAEIEGWIWAAPMPV